MPLTAGPARPESPNQAMLVHLHQRVRQVSGKAPESLVPCLNWLVVAAIMSGSSALQRGREKEGENLGAIPALHKKPAEGVATNRKRAAGLYR